MTSQKTGIGPAGIGRVLNRYMVQGYSLLPGRNVVCLIYKGRENG